MIKRISYGVVWGVLIASTVMAQSFTGDVSGSTRFNPSQTTLPSAAIDFPKSPSAGSIDTPLVTMPTTPSLAPQPTHVPLFKTMESWHDPLTDDNPSNIGITPWFRSFLPRRAAKNAE